MTRDLSSLPGRLLASVIGLDELVERELFGWEILDDSSARLRAKKSILCAALSPDSFSGSYGESFESPVALSVEASEVNLSSVEATRRYAPGWEVWLFWWERYEVALSYRVVDLVAGIPGTLRERFETSACVPTSKPTPVSRGGLD